MLEKRFFVVSPELFIVDGGTKGQVTVANTCVFKVKQQVKIQAPTLPLIDIEVKRIINATEMLVGPKSPNMREYQDISAYTTALGSFVFAIEQGRPNIPYEEFMRAVYEEEPTVAFRNVLVDKLGNPWTNNNPFPVVFSPVNTPKVIHIPVPTANTELSYTFTSTTKRFKFRVQNSTSKAQISYAVGTSNTDYWTVNRGSTYEESNLDLSVGVTLYFQLKQASQVVQILYWE